jgi:hypothetical protein
LPSFFIEQNLDEVAVGIVDFYGPYIEVVCDMFDEPKGPNVWPRLTSFSMIILSIDERRYYGIRSFQKPEW